jgi:hypothetical protein
VIQTIARVSCIFLAGMNAALAHEDVREHGAHVHGSARLDIALEGDTVQLDLDSPAANLLGFEHEPGDAKEKATLDKAVAELKQAGSLMAFTPAAECAQQKVMVKSGLLEGGPDHGHGHDAKEEHHHGDAAERDLRHADITVFWEIRCAHADVLREIDFTGLFQRFPAIQRLQVQAVLPGGQTAVELTPVAVKLKL